MQAGLFGHNHGVAHSAMMGRIQIMHRAMDTDEPTKGEKIVARLDQNDDGMLSPAELKDTKLGKHMTVDRFARIDANDDGMLDAGELDSIKRRGRGHVHGYGHMHGSDMMKNVVNAQFANYLTEPVEGDDDGTDIASRVMQELDGDHSGGLNSEEIAGTRLAQLIGGDFYNLDVDKNGALDKQELSDFITNSLLGDPVDPDSEIAAGSAPEDATPAVAGVVNPDAVARVQETQSTAPADDAATSVTQAPTAAQPGAVDLAPFSDTARWESIATVFEAALEILRNGSGSDSAFDIVQTLYGDIQKILQTS